ncbi:hypothetical protein F511_39795 [Dorcoceras hygrometricum]|uniref:Uncharacterized protein n=1 Tax=Dorcoceras hygrometricum TaxID=472368 RepID=A0A2Z7AML9_9LAMI|nr:hypothetical protein F511_39795 [Dorcoceras hygrometricum]
MSRFFYIKRDAKRDPWKCEMSSRDNVFTLTPRTPDRAPSLTSFLEAKRGKSYNAPELIKEDLMCFFKFSRKGVELAGDLEERMGKAEMLQFIEETEGEAESGSGRVPTFSYLEDSLVVAPTAAVATKFICNIAPERDLGRLEEASDTEAVGLFASQIAAAVVWGGEVVKLLTRAQREANDCRQLFIEAMGNHAELTAQLDELKAIRAQENKVAEAVQEALRSQIVTERVARATEEEALWVELEEALEAKTDAEAELERTRARAAEEVERLRAEGSNARTLSKDDFLKSSEFDRLCVMKSVAYFKSSFDGAVAQFRANGLPRSGGVAFRGSANAELGLSVELVGLMCLRRRATRVASAELGFGASSVVVTRRRFQCGTGLWNKAAEAVQEALRSQIVTERVARATEEEALWVELEEALEAKTDAEAELERTRARAAEEVERLRAEVTNARTLWKDDFLKSSEFDRLCVMKSVAYFKSSFDGAVAQFRANGYPEEEHPPFLDMKKALREMPDEDAEEE